MDHSKLFDGYDLSGIKRGEDFKFDPDRFRDVLKYFSLDSLVTEKNGVQRPEFSGNMDDVVDVSMNQQAVTRATDAKPVLATFGLGPCVSLVGYEPSEKVGFLTHYSASTEVNNSFPNLLATLYRIGLSHDGPTRFEVRLVGGWEREDKLIQELKTRVRHGTMFNMEIVEEDTGYVEEGRSVALDTRTGELFSYSPKNNPHTKIPDELEIMEMLIPCPADLVYSPR
ncbi:MAG: hypothetical protein Q8R53_00830 [Nanoarchaeota archaeon]|nr:hypothetical protein [Nanoarchaeota archaeon]